jgi:hypothetical protein
LGLERPAATTAPHPHGGSPHSECLRRAARPGGAERTGNAFEWPVVADLHLLESGFLGPDSHRDNFQGWDVEVLPVLRRFLDGEGISAD